jgi:pyruvate dehydrogenase E2 component (dihydrolipoyllysine-residue acetyltransferase)
MPDVTMPRLSDSMEEATIVAWHIEDGARVSAGQELAEVETDKATVAFEAEAEGTIELLVPAGETVALGAVVARIRGEGEEPAGALPGAATAAAPAGGGRVEAVQTAAPERPVAAGRSGQRAFASPLARRLAAAADLDLAALAGTGPRGRIVRADVERALRERGDAAAPAPTAANGGAPAPAAPEPAAAAGAKGGATVVELSRTQQLIARRMAESRATVPDFEVSVDVDMEEAWALREQLKASAAAGDVVPSLNDLVVLACARALREQPAVNGAYRDGHAERFERVNVGVAIAAPDALVVATVFDADRQSLGAIARTTRRLAAAVRDGSITPPELSGATFTVSNLGMFGVDRFSAVINAPQAAILAVGAVRQRAIAHEGEPAVRRTMTISLAADHRILYGADAARFLARVRELLERPLAALAG